MKKILILMLVLAVALSAMVSCDKLADLGIDLDAIFGKDTPDQGETPDDQPDTPAADADLQGAYDYVHQLTKTIAEKTGANYTLVGSVLIGDKNFTVNWTVTDSRVVLTTSEDGKTVTVSVPEPAEDIPYDLTFTIYNEKGESLSKTYQHVVPKFAYNTFAEYAAAADGEPLVITGIVSGVFSKATGSSANGLYIQDLNNEGGYYVYNLTDDPNGVIEPGMTVKVKGNKDIYNGTYELIDASVEIVDSTIKAVVAVDYTDILLNAAGLNDAALVGKQGMLVTVKGATILEAGDNGYYYFQLGAHKTYLRISSSNNATTKEALETIKSIHGANYGNTADITGIITQYNGNFYLSPVSADMISNVQIPERTDAEKVAFELDALKLDSKITADKVVDLLANGATYSEVAFAWAVESEYATIADGKLTITVPDSKTTITVTVTATCGEASETKSFEITLSKEIIAITDALVIGAAQEHNTYTTEKYLIAGVITSLYGTNEESALKYGNFVITDENGNTLVVYGLYSADGSVRYDAMEVKPTIGDYIVVLGTLGQYNGTVQTKNAWLLTHTVETSIPSASEIGVANPNYTADKYMITGVISALYGKEESAVKYGNVIIKDADGNEFIVYGMYSSTGATRYDAMTYKPTVGDTITVLGVLGSYNGTAQMKNGWIVACEKGAAEHEHNFVDGKCECGEEDPNYVPPTVDPELDEIVFDFGDKGDAAHNDGVEITSGTKTYTSNGYQLVLTGVSKVYGDAFDKNGNSILKFGTSSAVGTITFEVPANVTSVIIKVAPYKFYNDNNIVDVNGTTYTLGTDGYTDITVDTTTTKTITIASSKSAAKPRCMIDAIVFVLGEGSNTPVDPQPPVHEHNFVEGKCECGESDPNYVPPVVDPEVPTFGVVTPVAGTAYKFGMVQSNAGKTVYLKGGMSGYYMATTEDADAAIDVYLEETAGGYYLYTLNADGSKLYINMVVSGTHVNGAYEATATTVYTYDEARKSIVATVNGELYHFGTRNDNTYLTVGPCKVSYGGFDCQFYGATGSAPVDPQPPVHEHNFVEGKCECGEEDPNYVPPVVEPDEPVAGAPAGSADFDSLLPGSNGDSSYTKTHTTTDGWVIANSAVQAGGAKDMNPQFVVIGPDNTSKAICMNGKTSAFGTLTSPTLTGGVSKITIDYTKMFTDTKLGFTVKVTDLATGEVYTKSLSVELPKDEKYQVYSFEFVLDTPITGDFTIEVVNDCPSQLDSNKDRVTILDLSWYA